MFKISLHFKTNSYIGEVNSVQSVVSSTAQNEQLTDIVPVCQAG